MYMTTAIEVPVKAGILRDPITVAAGINGKMLSDKGVCISPPPPTIESTNPATKATRQRRKRISYSIVEKSANLPYVYLVTSLFRV